MNIVEDKQNDSEKEIEKEDVVIDKNIESETIVAATNENNSASTVKDVKATESNHSCEKIKDWESFWMWHLYIEN